MLQRAPGAFEQDPLLRVHQDGVLRRVSEQPVVEVVVVVQDGAGGDEVRVVGDLLRDAPAEELLAREEGDRLDAVLDVVPVAVEVASGAGESDPHADDRDPVLPLSVFLSVFLCLSRSLSLFVRHARAPC